MITDYNKLYDKEKAKIDKKLSKLLKKSNPESLYKPCDYIISSNGKRLRPFLVLISAMATGGNIKDYYNAACAVEILHNFTLVHDDIMDHADKRRGNPTLHIKYDVNTAILAGDSLIAVAYQQLLKDCNNSAREVVASFTKGVIEVCEGQSLDKDFEERKKVSLAEYKIMIQKKTAALAEMCCSIGARLGGGSEQEIKALEAYGRNLGLAFQIQDDLLDLIADESEFGKVVGSDLIEGKKTFLFLKALEKAKGADKKLLEKVIKNKGVKKTEIKTYEALYKKLGVIEDAAKEIKKYSGVALRSLNKINNKEAVNILIWLANALIKRNK